MLARLGVSESFSQAKVDSVYIVLLLANTDEEIIRLDISVQEVARVDELQTLQL